MSNRIVRGKFLIRKSTTHNGTPVLVIAGCALPDNFNIDDISDSDEMWIAQVMFFEGGMRLSNPVSPSWGAGSPEEFLEGRNQMVEDWKKVDTL